MMKLYYVRADDDNGENADMYVWAFVPAEARKLCQEYWKHLSGGKLSDTIIAWVDEVPVSPSPDVAAVVPWEKVVRHDG